MHSEKLKGYFEEHPEEKLALQRMQRQLREKKSVRQHLKSVPCYWCPKTSRRPTPVQKAVRNAKLAKGQVSSSVRRKRVFKAKRQAGLKRGFSRYMEP